MGHRSHARHILTKPAQVPLVVAEFVAEQLGGVEASGLDPYPDQEQTRWDHAREVPSVSPISVRRRSGLTSGRC